MVILINRVSAVVITLIRAVLLFLLTVRYLRVYSVLFILFGVVLSFYFLSFSVAAGEQIAVGKGIVFKRRIYLNREDIRFFAITRTPLEFLFGVADVNLVAKGYKVKLYFVKTEALETLK